MKTLYIVAFFLLAGWLAQVSAATEFSSLEERMTAKEFYHTGLNQLSPEQLAALNAWLAKQFNQVAEIRAETVTAAYEAEKETERVAKSYVSSAITGPFDGWNGSSVFRLANGQIWKQTNADVWHVKTSDAVAVIEKSGFMDTWLLHIDGYDRKTHVKRIK